MEDPLLAGEPPRPKQDAEALVLRGRPVPAVRFRRWLIVGATGAVAAILIGMSWMALEPPGGGVALMSLESDAPADTPVPQALSKAPGSYDAIPRLGPPLPGDLGRPILEQQRSLNTQPPPVVGAAPPAGPIANDPAQMAIEAERAAHASSVLVQLGGSSVAAQPVQGEPVPPAPSDSGAGPGNQQRKTDFAQSTDGDENLYDLRAAPSRWTLSAGTLIPATLLTGLNSDLPGTVLAQVSENVRDSATGRTVLIPQGARLIGRYDSAVAYGQRRALLIWSRIVLPDGSSIRIDNMPATDAEGYAGLEDRVDSHGWQLLKGIALSTLLGVGTQLSLGSDSDLVRAIRESTQQNGAQAGDQLTRRNLEVQPTIRIRPGWPVRVLVNKDLVLQPWKQDD